MATTTTMQGLPIPQSTDDPDVVDDITRLAQAIEKRLAGVYNSAADRDTKITAPEEGQMAILKDTNRVTVYLDSSWTQIYPFSGLPTITNSTSAPTGGVNGDIHFQV